MASPSERKAWVVADGWLLDERAAIKASVIVFIFLTFAQTLQRVVEVYADHVQTQAVCELQRYRNPVPQGADQLFIRH